MYVDTRFQGFYKISVDTRDLLNANLGHNSFEINVEFELMMFRTSKTGSIDPRQKLSKVPMYVDTRFQGFYKRLPDTRDLLNANLGHGGSLFKPFL